MAGRHVGPAVPPLSYDFVPSRELATLRTARAAARASPIVLCWDIWMIAIRSPAVIAFGATSSGYEPFSSRPAVRYAA